MVGMYVMVMMVSVTSPREAKYLLSHCVGGPARSGRCKFEDSLGEWRHFQQYGPVRQPKKWCCHGQIATYKDHTHRGRQLRLERRLGIHRSGSLEGVGQGSGVLEGQGRVITGLEGQGGS
jgi:hypothetical protein